MAGRLVSAVELDQGNSVSIIIETQLVAFPFLLSLGPKLSFPLRRIPGEGDPHTIWRLKFIICQLVVKLCSVFPSLVYFLASVGMMY